MVVLAGVMAASQLGINVGAALAGIGVVGIAMGFAAQETIANMIAGFLIFWDRPFKVGDFITTEEQYGEVREITMRTTRIRTMENTYVVIPNKQIIGDMLVNHSLYGEVRVNVPVGIAYREKIAEARRVLLPAARGVAGVLGDPPGAAGPARPPARGVAAARGGGGPVREESPLITPTVRQYLRDCLDHAVQILDVIDTYHELAST
ncbi:MAG TPA: mechanosensitive ion channel domain-containing protein [Gemmatimonadales bacterium]|nr:mechanosensitive ion channel domain-containing protein [Gemmatimonadales bacterium]